LKKGFKEDEINFHRVVDLVVRGSPYEVKKSGSWLSTLFHARKGLANLEGEKLKSYFHLWLYGGHIRLNAHYAVMRWK